MNEKDQKRIEYIQDWIESPTMLGCHAINRHTAAWLLGMLAAKDKTTTIQALEHVLTMIDND